MSDLRVCQTAKEGGDDHVALFGREPVDGVLETTRFFGCLETASRVESGRRELRARFLRIDTFAIELRVRSTGPQAIETATASQDPEPVAHATAARIEALGAPPYLDEDFECDLVGKVAVAEQSNSQAVDAAMCRRIEPVERRGVAVRNGFEETKQLGIVVSLPQPASWLFSDHPQGIRSSPTIGFTAFCHSRAEAHTQSLASILKELRKGTTNCPRVAHANRIRSPTLVHPKEIEPMKRILALTVAVSALGLGRGVTAQDSDNQETRNIVEVAQAAGSFKTLIKAAVAAGLADTLTGPGPLTVFAPTDAAFAKLPAGTIEALLADKAKLATILKYHVVAGAVTAAEVTKLDFATSVAGPAIRIVASATGVMVDNAKVIKADIEASNGIIHVIDTVIMPRGNLVDTAAGAGSFKTLLKAATVAGLADTLANKGPFTVFAPMDSAFAAIPEEDLANLLADKAALSDVLLFHVVPGRMLAKDVVQKSWIDTASGSALRVELREEGAFVDGARILSTDILAGNGIIHVIDRVMMPRPNVVETAIAAGSFKTLVKAVQAAGLVDALSGKGPFTVFAPTDAAFAKLPKGTVEALLADPKKLASILKYHVIQGRVLSTDLPELNEDDRSVTPMTLQGSALSIRKTSDGVTVNDAGVVTADILARNGVIHVIDTVVLPTEGAAPSKN